MCVMCARGRAVDGDVERESEREGREPRLLAIHIINRIIYKYTIYI